MRFYLDTFMFPAAAGELSAGLRMAGASASRYQGLLEELRTTAVIADEGGFEGLCFSEQHSNIEGVSEVSTNPILLDMFVASHTSRLKVGQLGLVLTANHPFRIAEDIALLDQMTNGRVFCGFVRGNSKRWVNMFSQHYGTEATHSDKGEADQRNLRAVQEAWTIIKKAWTQETVSHEGEFWTVPASNTRWDFVPTKLLGLGVSEDGMLQAIGCVPRPIQQPFPRVFAPLAFRMTTSKFWVGEGGTAVCFASSDEFLQTAHRVLSEVADASSEPRRGKVLAPGAFLMLGETREEAEKIRADYEWLFKFAYSVDPFNVPMGRVFFGTADDVSRQIEALAGVIDFDELFLWHNIGLHEEGLSDRAIEIFSEKIIPRFS